MEIILKKKKRNSAAKWAIAKDVVCVSVRMCLGFSGNSKEEHLSVLGGCAQGEDSKRDI